MPDYCVLAIDAGSSGCRAFVFDLRGTTVSSAHRDWGYDTPAEAAPLGRQFNPEDFWHTICQVINEAIQESGMSPSRIAAVSAASQRQSVVFLDQHGAELYAGPNTDLRALAEGFSIDNQFGSGIHRITGHTPSFLFAPAKLQWFKSHHPHMYGQIATVLSMNNWIIYRLCGRRVADLSSAADTGLVDIRERAWSSQLLTMLDLPQNIYPEIVDAGTAIGEVTSKSAAQTGLAAGTSVAVGGADTQCGLLGMGMNDQAEVGVLAGWSASIQMVTARPIIHPEGRIWSGCHVLPGRWILESNAAESGGAYGWLKGLLYEDKAMYAGQDAYAIMDQMAEQTSPGADGVLAFIGPRAMDMTRLKPGLGGFIFSITPSVTGIGRRHLVRAALENLAFAFRANLDQLTATSEMNVERVSIGGGLAQSRPLVQILSDVLGRPVISFQTPQVTACGAAMCAAAGAGLYANLEAAARAMQPQARAVEPDEENFRRYAEYYDRWMHTSQWLENLIEETG
jgi:sugar (pentulose or hexulose) kinase